MIVLLTLLSFSVQAHTLTCEQSYPAPFESNCRRACEDGILVDCRRNETNPLSLATVDLSKIKGLNSSQLITSDASLVKAYQISHGAMDLQTEVQSLARAEYGNGDAPQYQLLSKPEPKLIIKKGSVFNATLPLTFTKDCPIVMGITGPLSQAQGMMLSGSILLMNKCEAAAEKNFRAETFHSALLVNALELESKDHLAKGTLARGYFLAKNTDAYLDLRLKTERESTRIPISHFQIKALQNLLTMTVKDPHAIAYLPLLNQGLNDLTQIQMSLSGEPDPSFRFNSPKKLVDTPHVKLSANRVQVKYEADAPTLFINQSTDLSYSMDSATHPILRLAGGNSVLNSVWITPNEYRFNPNQFMIRIHTKNHEEQATLLLSNTDPKNYQISRHTGELKSDCLIGKLMGIFDSNGVSIQKIKLPKESPSRFISMKKHVGKSISSCLVNATDSFNHAQFEIYSID